MSNTADAPEIRKSLHDTVQDRNEQWASNKVGGAGRVKTEADEDMPPPPAVKKPRKETLQAPPSPASSASSSSMSAVISARDISAEIVSLCGLDKVIAELTGLKIGTCLDIIVVLHPHLE